MDGASKKKRSKAARAKAMQRETAEISTSAAVPDENQGNRIFEEARADFYQRAIDEIKALEAEILKNSVESTGPVDIKLAPDHPDIKQELTEKDKDDLAMMLHNNAVTMKQARDVGGGFIFNNTITAATVDESQELGGCPQPGEAEKPYRYCGGAYHRHHNTPPPPPPPVRPPSPLFPSSSSPPLSDSESNSHEILSLPFPDNFLETDANTIIKAYCGTADILGLNPEHRKTAYKEAFIMATIKRHSQSVSDEQLRDNLKAMAKKSHDRFMKAVTAHAIQEQSAQANSSQNTPSQAEGTGSSSAQASSKKFDNTDKETLSNWPVSREKFVSDLMNAAQQLGETIFDAGAADQGKSVRMWFENGELHWAVEQTENIYTELATLKECLPKTHDCTGPNYDGHSFCLDCLTEMKYDDLLDFAPALGFPPIRRPKGWKPPFKEETVEIDTTSKAQDEKCHGSDSLAGTSTQTDGLDARIFEEEVEGAQKHAQSQNEQKKKGNNKKKKNKEKNSIQSTSAAANETATAGSTKFLESSCSKDLQQSSLELNLKTLGNTANRTPKWKILECERRIERNIQLFEKHCGNVIPVTLPGERSLETNVRPRENMKHNFAKELHSKAPQRHLQGPSTEENHPDISTHRKENAKSEMSTTSLLPILPSSAIQSKQISLPDESRAIESAKKGKISGNMKKNMTALEEHNTLRAQRLELCLGIGRFVLESISCGKRPFFDISLDGRIEFGHANLLYPMRLLRGGRYDVEGEDGPSGFRIEMDRTEIKIVTAPIVRIHDVETPEPGDGMKNIIRKFGFPNLIAKQAMFRDVNMVHNEISSDNGRIDVKGKGKAREVERDVAVPASYNTKFGLRSALKNAQAYSAEPVFLGSQQYRILPTHGPRGRQVFNDLRPLTTTFTRAIDMCEDVQVWVNNQKRNIAIRDVLGDDPLWPVNPGIPRKPANGGESKAMPKLVPGKKGTTVASKSQGEAEVLASAKSTKLMRELEEKEKLAAMLTIERDETLALMKKYPTGRQRTEWGFDAHLQKMNECLSGIQANNLKARAIIKETLRDHPWPRPGESSS